ARVDTAKPLRRCKRSERESGHSTSSRCLARENQGIPPTPALIHHIVSAVLLYKWLLMKFAFNCFGRSRDSSDAENPGNNLYVTGLSPRITKDDLEKHFATEGKVVDIHLVLDPWTRESRGFGFVTMARIEDADRCIKYLDRSVLEGRVITVEKARRRWGRTPTPGRYLGMRSAHGRRHSPSYSPHWRGRYRSPYSSDRDRSYSPYYRRRSYSPYDRRRSYSSFYNCYRYRSRSPYGRYSRSPVYHRGRRSRSYSCDSRSCSPDYSVSPYYRRRYYRSISCSPSASRVRSYSRSFSPHRRSLRRSYSRSFSPPRKSLRRSYSRSFSPPRRSSMRSYSRSFSPPRRSSMRSYSRSFSPPRKSSMRSYSQSISPPRKSLRSYSRSYFPRGSRLRRNYSRSCSPRYRSKRSLPCSRSPSRGRRYSRESYSHSRSASSYSRSYSSVS
ncbi:Serine/arginine-rich splicing factor SR45a, partial [Ananas comosus]